jgi:hypothetical protein
VTLASLERSPGLWAPTATRDEDVTALVCRRPWLGALGLLFAYPGEGVTVLGVRCGAVSGCHYPSPRLRCAEP